MSYWQNRQEELYKAGEMKINQYFGKLEKAFLQTKRELQWIINDFYTQYATENGLTFADAQKQLDKAEIGELKEFIRLSMQNIDKHNQTVNNMSIKARITRYQALEAQIDASLRKLYAIDYQAMAEQIMKEVYEETYYHTWYNIDRYHGFHSNFAQIVPNIVETLLEYPFNGANFSTRLWKQKDHLQTQLMEALTTMLVQGKPPHALVNGFAKTMKVKKFEAYRLLHTEGSYVIGQATHAAYKEDDVEKYRIIATLDSKTCGICGEQDGEVYEMEEAIVGENMAPFHCFCRCTDEPYYEDMDISNEVRAARDPVTGKVYDVPADMTFKDWKKAFVEGGSKEREILSSDADSESELGTFKKKIIDDEGMKKPYYDVLKDKFSHGSDDAKRVFNKYIPDDSIADYNYEATAKYQNGKIYMHYNADLNNPRGTGATWFHEHGHMIDDLAGDVSNNNEFVRALNVDFLDILSKKSYSEIEEELVDMRTQSAVSDIFNGVSRDIIKGVATHPLRPDGSSYWTDETVRQEAFAHMFECQFDNLRYAEMKKYFPRALTEFERILKGL